MRVFGRYDTPKTAIPTPVRRGVKTWRTASGVAVVRVHYSADPEKDNERWLQQQLLGYVGGMGGRDWRREMEIDFEAYDGDPVYPMFSPEDCVKDVAYERHLELWVGIDVGYRHPAVTFWQFEPRTSQLRALREFYPTEDPEECPGMSTTTLGREILRIIRTEFPQAFTNGLRFFIDPAAGQHKETSDESSIEQLAMLGIACESDKIGRKSRVTVLRNFVERPGHLLVHPSCRLLTKALAGAYRYPKANAQGVGPKDPEMPDTSGKVQSEPYIHIMDSMEYVAACMLMEYGPTPKPIKKPGTETNYGDSLPDEDTMASVYSQLQFEMRQKTDSWDDDDDVDGRYNDPLDPDNIFEETEHEWSAERRW